MSQFDLNDILDGLQKDREAPTPTTSAYAPPVINREELERIKKASFSRVLGKIYDEYYADALENDPDYLKDTDIAKDVNAIMAKRHEKQQGAKSTHCFVTVNTKPDTPLADLMRKVEKALKKKWITDWMYCFEQRGTIDKDMGKGIHVHILINRGTEPAKLKKEMRNTFKDLVGNADCPNHINFGWRTTPSDVIKTQNYIKGIKKDTAKDAKHDADVQWRADNNLQPYYTSS